MTRWRNENAVFQAELNKKRQEIWGAAQDKLRGLVIQAVDVLESELEKGNFKAAVEVLKAVNLYGNVSQPDGATDPDVIMVKQAEKWARQEMEKEPPSGDPLGDVLGKDAKFARLVQERLAELKTAKSNARLRLSAKITLTK